MSSSLAPAELSPAVASWRDQIERLSEHASPCRYPAPARGTLIRKADIDFFDRPVLRHKAQPCTAKLIAAELTAEHGPTIVVSQGWTTQNGPSQGGLSDGKYRANRYFSRC